MAWLTRLAWQSKVQSLFSECSHISVWQRVTYLTKSSVAEELPRERQKTESEEPKAKRHCDSTEQTKYEANSSNKHEAAALKSSADNNKLANSNEGDNEIASYPMQNATMKKAKTVSR